MDLLGKLAAMRDEILLAEIGVLIHDIGKLSREFVAFQAELSRQLSFEHHLVLRRAMRGYYSLDRAASEEAQAAFRSEVREWASGAPDDGVDRVQRREAQEEIRKRMAQSWDKITEAGARRVVEEEALVPDGFLPDRLLQLLDGLSLGFGAPLAEERTIGDFVECHHDLQLTLDGPLVRLLTAKTGGVDGIDSGIDKGGVTPGGVKQDARNTFIATAFGYEPDSQHIDLDALTGVRLCYADTLAAALERVKAAKANGKLTAPEWHELLCDPKNGLRTRAEKAFGRALGETRRGANDVTLWDHSYSVASLYKAALAEVLLTGVWTHPRQKALRWRLLRVSYDGLGFWGQAHHVTDMLGRLRVVGEMLDHVRQRLEVEYPVGNEIYRDENGSVFLMPDLGTSDPQRDSGLNAHDGQGERDASPLQQQLEWEVRDLVASAIADAGLSGELAAECYWHPDSAGEDEMPSTFGDLLRDSPRPWTGDAHLAAQWWQRSTSEEICTVCGVRPVGYEPEDRTLPRWATAQNARERHICCVCLSRRGRRARDWLRSEPHKTIWTAEVVDGNGRFVLIVGQFGLEHWLRGTAVRTMLTAPNNTKHPSPARTRRVWETARRFWEEVREQIPDHLGRDRPRLAVSPRNKHTLADHDPKLGLGSYHSYELRAGGFSIEVVWDPVGEQLILTEYVADLGRRLGLSGQTLRDEDSLLGALKSWLEAHAEQGALPLYSPSGYSTPAKECGRVVDLGFVHSDVTRYAPHIPLLTEPSLSMSLVPADRTMQVVRAVREKYEREMSKVRDRLPLHLGVVIAPRRTPLRAVLEAGRAMMMRGGSRASASARWEAWEVLEKPGRKAAADAPAYLTHENHHFDRWLDVHLRRDGDQMHLRLGELMGDGQTPDQWYPYLLRRPLTMTHKLDPAQDLTRACELNEGEKVYISPATFDFEFLDTTARRFEISYDGNARRRGRATRPYRLGETAALQEVWSLIRDRLTTSQWMALDELIERKRAVWSEPRGRSLEYSDAFRRFVADTLRSAEWKWAGNQGWAMLTADEQRLLKRTAVEGVLNDVIRLFHEALKESRKEL